MVGCYRYCCFDFSHTICLFYFSITMMHKSIFVQLEFVNTRTSPLNWVDRIAMHIVWQHLHWMLELM